MPLPTQNKIKVWTYFFLKIIFKTKYSYILGVDALNLLQCYPNISFLEPPLLFFFNTWEEFLFASFQGDKSFSMTLELRDPRFPFYKMSKVKQKKSFCWLRSFLYSHKALQAGVSWWAFIKERSAKQWSSCSALIKSLVFCQCSLYWATTIRKWKKGITHNILF